MAFYIVRGDLVSMEVDAIVASANVNLKMVEGVTRAIFHRAGDLNMLNACREIGHCDPGKAVLTPSFNIKNCKAIIHAVGPNYINGKHGEAKKLISAYESVFKICDEHGFKSVAFPILSAEFNYPLRECYDIAEKCIKTYLSTHPESDVFIVIYKSNFDIFDDEFKDNLTKYLNFNFKTEERKQNIKDYNLDVVNFISKIQQEKNISDEELILNANLDYRYLSRLRDDSTFIPSKFALLSIGIGLNLNISEMNDLLKTQGYFFGSNTMYELAIRFYIDKKIYDIYKINDCLFYYELELLSQKIF